MVCIPPLWQFSTTCVIGLRLAVGHVAGREACGLLRSLWVPLQMLSGLLRNGLLADGAFATCWSTFAGFPLTASRELSRGVRSRNQAGTRCLLCIR